ncbi:hypothetical protein KKF34_05650 [Myxococcota bacterium]|nr:hypothetical protein [Myxococcota bacterium]MBU1496346.1 hypothetical protein [Myxococcota bacterium]
MSDRSLIYKGYIADFEKLEEGLFLFLHDNEECYTTMAVKVGLFFDLYRGDRFTTRMHNSAECGGYCLNRESIALCPVKCECAFVRDIITTINTRRR